MPGLIHFKLKDKVPVSNSGPVGALGLMYLTSVFLKVRVCRPSALQTHQRAVRVAARGPAQRVPHRPPLLRKDESQGG